MYVKLVDNLNQY